MAQKWLCSTGRYMDGHPEHLVTWAADFLVPIVDIVLALILDASLRLVPGEENACDWRDEEGKKSLSKNKAINSRHRYYTQLFGGAASLAAEPRHQSRYMHSLDFPNLETFHPGNYSYPALSCCRCKDSSPNNSIHRASIKLLDQFITWMYRLVPHHRQMHAKTACGYCNEPKRRSAARTTFASTGIVKRWPSPKAPFQYVAHLARIALPPTPSATARQNAARSPGEA
ncbi:hypothetical protein M431DRAFT_526786 [Trichoderma harzianum CBS 226.95]|uniref:Uncharacterized protein n=1 Tax=Trichoderma harzianum CBS 226.95 TaxID=983964 RepID=A0A2T4AUL2_TRIHA|nr:hypothetical protein M431DRAFT_526786 [Trichoderma harzianum CBS 226.95]PTB60729.1 hypothetical protein M431DRAFT_526786 [Trichoderma harzianum CBS 226.95]